MNETLDHSPNLFAYKLEEDTFTELDSLPAVVVRSVNVGQPPKEGNSYYGILYWSC